MQLLDMMDAAVQAASSGTHVEGFLEVRLVTVAQHGTKKARHSVSTRVSEADLN